MMRGTLRHARKQHRCTGVPSDGCTGVIQVGEVYGYAVASPQHDDYGNDRWWVSKACLPCARTYSATWPPVLFEPSARPEGGAS
jgi:hypothetical protein